MNAVRLAWTCALVLGVAGPAVAVVVPGGGPRRSDCWMGFEVDDADAPRVRGVRVQQPACEGACAFTVRLCTNEPVDGCSAATVTGVPVNTGALVLPALGGGHACGDPTTLTVPQSGRKIGKLRLRVVSESTEAGMRPDKDKLVLRCRPNPGGTGPNDPPTVTIELGPPGRAGDGYFTALARVANCPGDPSGACTRQLDSSADCATAVSFDLAPALPTASTTGMATMTVLNPRPGSLGGAAPLDRAGAPFDCTRWVEDGPGILETPAANFDNPLAGDTANILQSDD